MNGCGPDKCQIPALIPLKYEWALVSGAKAVRETMHAPRSSDSKLTPACFPRPQERPIVRRPMECGTTLINEMSEYEADPGHRALARHAHWTQ